MDPKFHVEVLERFDLYKQCPTCGMAMEAVPKIGLTGGSRSLLPWYFCEECSVWAALCKRGPEQHLMLTYPQHLADVLTVFIHGKDYVPMLSNTELQGCWAMGHLPAFRLN